MAWSQGDEGTDQRIVPWVDRIRAAARLAPDGGVLPVIGAIRFALRVVCGLSRRGGAGGDEETRTPDPLLAKEMLCQLSYVPAAGWVAWWAFLDSNQRPLPYQGSALTS